MDAGHVITVWLIYQRFSDISRDVVPTGAGDGDCPCVAGDEDEGTSPGDFYISKIARSADQFELSVICEDDHRDVAADPGERE